MSETLGLMLVRANKITRGQLYEALREQRATGARLGDILYGKGWIGEDDVAMLIAKQLDIPFIDAASLKNLPIGIADRVPKTVAQEYRVVPVKLLNRKLTLAMEDQRTRNYMDELSYLIGVTCIPALAAPRAVRETLKRFYGIEIVDEPVREAPDDDTAEIRPAEKMEALPVARVDADGRAVASMRNAAGEEKVYLLTEIADAEAVEAAPADPPLDVDQTMKIPRAPRSRSETTTAQALRSPVAAPSKGAAGSAGDPRPAVNPFTAGGETGSDEPTRLLQRAARPASASGIAAPTADDDAHDNFLAPDLQDDGRPMFKPKVVTAAAPAPTAAAAPPATPAPAAPAPAAPADAVPEFDIVRAAERLFECQSTAAIGDIVVRFARHLVERAMFFEISEHRFHCVATTDGLELDNKGKQYAIEDLVLLAVIAQNRQPAYGPTPEGEMYERFFETLGMMRPPVILLYPLVVGGRTAAVLYAGLAAPRPADEFGDLQLLFKEAATALEILLG